MLESGDHLHKSGNNGFSPLEKPVVLGEVSTSKLQKIQKPNLWQRLWGQNTQRKTRRRRQTTDWGDRRTALHSSQNRERELSQERRMVEPPRSQRPISQSAQRNGTAANGKQAAGRAGLDSGFATSSKLTNGNSRRESSSSTFFPSRTVTKEAPTANQRRSRRQQVTPANLTAGKDRSTPISLPELPKGQVKRRSRTRESGKSRSLPMTLTLYATRMLILSVGLGVLAGTVLSVWDPASRSLIGSQPPVKQASIAATVGQENIPSLQSVKLRQELSPLKLAIQTLSQKTPQIVPGVFLLDLDTNDFVDISGGTNHSAASTIKIAILVAFFQDVDAGKIRLDEPLVMRKELIATGSGNMQFQPPGTRYTALETATNMIIVSDNTATNMLIARLGGLRALNQRFRSWGLVTTTINSVLPDLGGTNITSPKELALLLARVSQGELLTMRSRDRMLDIMRHTENNSQLPQGLGAGATIAHKTGDIGNLIGDVGLIDLPNGKRYAIAVLAKRSFNDDQAYEVVAQISKLTYQYFSRPANGQPSFTPNATPASPAPSDSQTEDKPDNASPEPTDSQPDNTQNNRDNRDNSASL
jgi:beta-lactamase class A